MSKNVGDLLNKLKAAAEKAKSSGSTVRECYEKEEGKVYGFDWDVIHPGAGSMAIARHYSDMVHVEAVDPFKLPPPIIAEMGYDTSKLEDLSYLFPVFDELATFESIYVVAVNNSRHYKIMKEFYRAAVNGTDTAIGKLSINVNPLESVIVLCRTYEMRKDPLGTYLETLYKWDVPFYHIDLLPDRLQRALKEWSHIPLSKWK
jgi:hypothetical protein